MTALPVPVVSDIRIGLRHEAITLIVPSRVWTVGGASIVERDHREVVLARAGEVDRDPKGDAWNSAPVDVQVIVATPAEGVDIRPVVPVFV